MTDPLDVLANPRLGEEKGDGVDGAVVLGYFASTATTVDDELEARIPTYDMSRTYGPFRFTPIPATDGMLILPTRDDPCWIAFDDDSEPALVNWWSEADTLNKVNGLNDDVAALDTRIDALEALTPFVRVNRGASQAVTAGVWALLGINAVDSSQATSGVLALVTTAGQEHVRVDKAGLYLVTAVAGGTLAAGDHIIALGRNDSATTIAGVGTGALEMYQARFAPAANTGVPAITWPFTCNVGDKLWLSTFRSNSQNVSPIMTVTKIGN